jgi:hypothetical protein
MALFILIGVLLAFASGIGTGMQLCRNAEELRPERSTDVSCVPCTNETTGAASSAERVHD